MENKTTVLCVDDEVNILHSLKRLLRKEPYKLLTANCADEAFEILKQNEVQLILSDQRMPEMTGTELLKEVKKKYPNIVRVILSGYADLSVILEAINEGEIYRFLSKPWNDNELKTTIKQCLEHYAIIEENKLLLKTVQGQNNELECLNDNLENLVKERTEYLQLSQDLLEKIPVAIIGIDLELKFVLSNGKSKELIPELSTVMLGKHITSFLSEDLVKKIEESISNNKIISLDLIHIFSGDFKLLIKPVDKRGVLIMFSSKDCREVYYG